VPAFVVGEPPQGAGLNRAAPATLGHRRSPGTARPLLDAAQKGDPAAQNELLRRYERLVHRAVWNLRLPVCVGVSRDDLAQEARIGLLAAIRAWRPERGPFPAFADRCVTNHALLALKAACRREHLALSQALPLDAASNRRARAGDHARAGTLLDTLAAPADPRTDPEARLLVREQLQSVLQALPALGECERTAVRLRLDGYSHGQIAQIIGRTPKASAQVAYRARVKLSAALPSAA
jgi:RNA polymerase sporulation-specific sigma factor